MYMRTIYIYNSHGYIVNLYVYVLWGGIFYNYDKVDIDIFLCILCGGIFRIRIKQRDILFSECFWFENT